MNAPSLLAPPRAEPACCDDETWKPLPCWPHEVSTCGRGRIADRLGDDGIWRLGAPLPPQPDKRPGKGYLYFDLRDGKRRRRVPVAVAVLEAHVGPRPTPEHEASHVYGIRADNHLPGLLWETRAENLARIPQHAAERAAAVTPLPPEAVPRYRSQVRGGSARLRRRRYGVTAARRGNAAQGTGSSRPFSASLSLLIPVQPLSRALRTSFRSLRNRQAS